MRSFIRILRILATVAAIAAVSAHNSPKTLAPLPCQQKLSGIRALATIHPSTSSCSSSTVLTSVNRGGASGGSSVSGGLAQSAKVLFLFALWYALNVVYNITNKTVLNALPLPSLVAVAQLGVGSLYATTAWASGLRKGPRHDVAALVRSGGLKALLPIGCAHGVGQVATVLSLGAGAVSFTHIVKALEPLFSAGVSAVVSGEVLRPQVYATLLPVVGGVSFAVAKELSFSWWAFGTAMLSNLSFALRAVLSKIAMLNGKGGGEAGAAIASLSAPSLFGVVTCLSFALMAPVALVAEGKGAAAVWSASVSNSGASGPALAKSVLLSGLFHYLNNEVMYLVLDNVHPVTLAVGNTLKRVVIIVASLVIFRNPMAPEAQLGSAVGIAGVLLYSLTKQYYDRVDAAAKKN
mmetsp:Transcript_48386/g.95930  ORF Transcript_48386/g.95930 Transcript_48386/m.95930 type:complete len:407 (+) Transcript_48386:43-1263(+)